jgi:hypothetical protein
MVSYLEQQFLFVFYLHFIFTASHVAAAATTAAAVAAKLLLK